jgi:hypothetical protein
VNTENNNSDVNNLDCRAAIDEATQLVELHSDVDNDDLDLAAFVELLNGLCGNKLDKIDFVWVIERHDACVISLRIIKIGSNMAFGCS